MRGRCWEKGIPPRFELGETRLAIGRPLDPARHEAGEAERRAGERCDASNGKTYTADIQRKSHGVVHVEG